MSFQELYQISSGGETDNLKSMLTKLQEENRKLRLEYEVTANSQPGIWLISFINIPICPSHNLGVRKTAHLPFP